MAFLLDESLPFESPETLTALRIILQLVLFINDHLINLIAAATCFGVADRADYGVCGKIILSSSARMTAPGVTPIGLVTPKSCSVAGRPSELLISSSLGI